jgi:vancomycin resistance protein YoaR
MHDQTEVSAPRHVADDGAPDERTAGHPRSLRARRWPWVVGLSALVVVVVVVAGWALDASSGGVARNVVLAGVDVGGVAEDELPIRVAAIADTFSEAPVEVVSEGRTYRTTAAEIGLEVDQRATVDRTLDVGHEGFLLARPVQWVASFLAERRTDLVLRVNESVARPAVVELQGDDRIPPTEPDVERTDDGFALVAGQPGRGIDPDALVQALPRSAGSVDDPIRVAVRSGPIPPEGSDDVALAAIAAAEELTAEPLDVLTPGGRATIQPEVLRGWVTLTTIEEGAIEVEVDPERVTAGLEAALADLEGAPVDAGFTVEGGQVRIIPDQDGVVCCAPDSPDRVFMALRTGAPSVELDLQPAQASFRTADAESLGIVEEIGRPDEFGPTTQFACCQSRVQNIHRISDIVRGAVIRPGETFSVNDHVGQRTIEKGFAEGGVIIDGRFTTDVGGGVSQFATTMFNAALFAGLDFETYQSHSIYISRYPRGREATLNYPNVDLAVTNNTPYGVLIWPEYTGTSVTVRLYSTRYAEVVVGEPTSASAGRCTRWTTPRTRTYPDGRVEQDSVFALYRPGEGVNC